MFFFFLRRFVMFKCEMQHTKRQKKKNEACGAVDAEPMAAQQTFHSFLFFFKYLKKKRRKNDAGIFRVDCFFFSIFRLAAWQTSRLSSL